MTQYQDVPSNLGDGLLWFTMVYYGLLVYGGLGFRVYQVTFQFWKMISATSPKNACYEWLRIPQKSNTICCWC